MYTAIFFDKETNKELDRLYKENHFLLHHISIMIRDSWTRIEREERHVTLWMGDCPNEYKGKFVSVIVDAIGMNEKAVAFRVKPEFGAALSKNATPHITLSVNRGIGGKPYDSNFITEWVEIHPFQIEGEIREHE